MNRQQQQQQAPSNAPVAGGSGTDLIEVLVGIAALLAALAVAIPALVVAVIITPVARRGLARHLTVIAGLATAAVVAVGVAVGRNAGLAYLAPIRTVIAGIRHHSPLSSGILVGTIPGTLPVAVPLGVLAALAWEARRRHRTAKANPSQPGRDDTTPAVPLEQLAPLRAGRHAGEQRVVLGRYGRTLLATEVEGHTCVVAPTRAGKSRSLVVPSLLSWRGPVVATSTKADLLADPVHGNAGAYAYRSTLGPVWVYDPAGASAWPSAGWSPIGRSSDWQGALRSARAMVDASTAGAEPNSTSQFFASRAAGALALCLHVVAITEGSMVDVARLIREASTLTGLADDIEEGLLVAPGAAPEALSAVGALRSGSEGSQGDTMATLGNVISPFADDPKVVRSSMDIDFSPAELIDRNGTLFIIGADTDRLAPLYACLVDEIVAYVQTRTLAQGPLSPRMLLCLDEVANIAPIRDLPALLSTLSGHGVTALLAFQALSQMRKRWGETGPSEILGNSASRLFASTGDVEVLEYLGRAMGHRLVESRSVTANLDQGLLGANQRDPHSVGVSLVERQAFDAAAFALSNEPLLLHSGVPPVHLAWRHYDKDRTLARRSLLPLPEPDPDLESDPEPGDVDLDDIDWSRFGLVDDPPASEPDPDRDSTPEPDWDPTPPSEPATVIPGPPSWWGSDGSDLTDDI